MKPSSGLYVNRATVAPALYVAPRGSNHAPLTPGQTEALEALWPALVASMLRGAPPSSDYVASRCECTRAQVALWFLSKGCARSDTKWRLPSIVNKRNWRPN